MPIVNVLPGRFRIVNFYHPTALPAGKMCV